MTDSYPNVASSSPGPAGDVVGVDTALPDLFQSHPATRAVFNRYGLRGCGGERGPAETLGFFAAAHGVAIEPLLEQVRRVIRDPLARQQASAQLHDDARPRLADAIYRPFFLAGIATVLTVGAAWGVLLLWKIGVNGSFTGVTVHEVNAHGHAQIMGWVGLFIMGFAYQAFPRMWHVDLPAPKMALATWIAMLLSIAGRSTAMRFAGQPWAGPMHLAGVVVQTAAVVVFIGQLRVALRRSGQPAQPYIGFVLAALGFFLLQTVYGGWHMHRLMHAADRDAMLAQIATFQSPLRDWQIHGMAMLMIFGVGIRMFPAIFNWPTVPHRRAWAALVIILTAVVLETSLFLIYRLTGYHAAAAAMIVPWLMLPIGGGMIVARWRVWRSTVAHNADDGSNPHVVDRRAKFVRIAFAWLFVSFTMLLLLPIYQAVSGIAFSHAYYGAVRHAITVGFISMMIVGMAAKVVPTLRGIEPQRLPALWLPFVLINLGCFLRVTLQILTDWDAGVYRFVAISGALEWTGLAFWAAHLSAVMLGLGRYRTSAQASWGPVPESIRPDHRVAAVLDWYPQLEPTFVEHGFDLIRNPLLRRTIARQVTLRQVCRMKDVDMDRFIAALNEAIRVSTSPDGACAPQRVTPVTLTVHGAHVTE